MSAMDYSGPDRRRGGPDRRAPSEIDADPDRRRPRPVPGRHRQHPRPGARLRGRRRGGRQSRRAIDRALETSPDIILMDLSLPAPGGIETTQRIKRELPSTGIIVLAVRRGRGRAVRRDQGRRRGVHPQGRRPGRPRHDHPPRRRRRVPDQRQGLRQAGRRVARPQGVPRAGGLRPGGRARSSRRCRRARSRSSTTSPRA